MIQFPESLQIIGFDSIETDPMLYRDEFENGYIRQTRRMCLAMQKANVTAQCCSNECYDEFLDFWKSAAHGAVWFLFNNPEDGQNKKARIIGGKFGIERKEKIAGIRHIDFMIEYYI